jgi:predicted secreted hydrolase
MTPSLFPRIGLAVAIVATLGALAGFWVLSFDDNATQAQDEADADLLALVASLNPSTGGALTSPWELSVPRDYGAHPEAGAETWNIVAHLRDEAGDALAVMMTLSRLGAVDGNGEVRPFGPGPVHISQVLLTSTRSDLRGADDRASRIAGTAGHDADRREVWIDDWVLRYGDAGLELDLRLRDRSLRLSLDPLKEPLTSDVAMEGTARGFAVPRLAVTGSLLTDQGENRLTGTGWVDRLWGDIPLPGGPLVRDRFVLQLTDGTDLSLLLTRRRDGRGIATMDGVRVAASGDVRALDEASVRITPLFATEGDTVPTAWRVVGADLDLEARVRDVIQLDGFGPEGIFGLLTVTGMQAGRAVEGAGTVLLSSEGVS